MTAPFGLGAEGMVSGSADVAPEKASADEAARSSAWLAAIVAHSDDAIISKDLDGIITSWNAGARRLFGYEAEEAIGQSVLILIPEDRIDEEPEILARIGRGEHIKHFDTIRRRKDGTLVDVSLSVSPIKDEAGRIVGASKIARDITERRERERQQSLLLSEMNHRIRNTLATVQALATQTMRGAPPEERAAFGARLQTLARAHDLLTLERWNRTTVRDVIQRVLQPFEEQHRDRLTISGVEEAALEAGKAMMLAMALHELATNAIKYGALSAPLGRIAITWDRVVDRPGDRIRVHWRESGGPSVTSTQRQGFGTRLIALSGGSIAFEPEGIACTLELTR